jgi:hypothetical protein
LQSFERAMNFQKDLEENLNKFNYIVKEANGSRKFKKLDEIPSIDEFVS